MKIAILLVACLALTACRSEYGFSSGELRNGPPITERAPVTPD